jgi:hypothetical protein
VADDIFSRYQQGLTFGRGIRAENEQRQQRSRLSELAQTAYGATDPAGRDAAIGEAIGVDPTAGFKLAEVTQGNEDRKRKALVESAAFLGNLPPEQQQAAYTGQRARLAQAFPDLQLPEAWAQAAPTVAAINQTYGAQQDVGANFRTVGNSLIDLRKDPTKAVFTAPESFRTVSGEAGEYQVTPDGLRLLPTLPSQGTAAPSQQAPAVPMNASQDFAELGRQFGIQPTSATRTPERNAEVGGVANSFHLTGQASDWAVPPAQKPAFIAAAQKLGYQAIDEGDHVHIEPPGSPTGQPAPFRPKGSVAAQREAEKYERDRREAEIRDRLGATPPGFRVNAAGTAFEPSPGGPKPAGATATEGERKAAVLLKRLEGSLGQLQTAVGQTPGAASPSLTAEAVRRIPFVGGDTSANVFTGQGRQRVEAAQLDILDAALTLGTGAAYTREQLEGYRRSFFPQIGDSRETISDKQARLDNVIAAARIAAGRAAPESGQSAPQGGPTLGTIQDGYRFRGGNPADPSSWEEVR